MPLDKYLNHIHYAYLYASMGDTPRAKKECVESVKILNQLAKTDLLLPSVLAACPTLSRFSLNLHEKISQSLRYNEKLIWLNSKLAKQFYFPVVDFGGNLDSVNAIFIDQDVYTDEDDACRQLPDNIDAQFDRFDVKDWTHDGNQLLHLYQDILENCSFVSLFLSIVGTLNYYPMTLIEPHAQSTKYRVKLRFNGTNRLVTIDNFLPHIRNNADRNLIIKSSLNKDLLWPALIEKAYLKIMGHGYRFIGSNMAIDTFMLTGWIPEIISINNYKLPDNFPTLWKLYKRGEVLLGLGTANLTKQLATELNLISEHDYSVHTYDSATSAVVLKNPWIEDNQTSRRFLRMENLNYFRYLYVNWNTDKLFSHKTSVGFLYLQKGRKPENEKSSKSERSNIQLNHYYENPQYSFTNTTSTDQEVWLLLETHLPFNVDQMARLLVFETQNDRVLSPIQYRCVNTGSEYSKNKHLLVKYVAQPGKSYTTVVFSTHQSNFTLTGYSNIAGMAFSKAKYLYGLTLPELNGEWTTGGGNWTLSSFTDNPQYLIEVKQDIDGCVMALYSRSKQSVCFHIFHCEQSERYTRVRNFDKSKLLFCENYAVGVVVASLPALRKGLYKLVLSSYEPVNTHMDYTLLVNYSAPQESLNISSIPSSLGLFTQSQRFEWEGGNRFKMFFVVNNHHVKATFVLKHFNDYETHKFESVSDYRPSLRGSVFKSTGRPIQVNDKWNDSLFGTYVDVTLEEPGEYVLLVERFEAGKGSCLVDMGSSARLETR